MAYKAVVISLVLSCASAPLRAEPPLSNTLATASLAGGASEMPKTLPGVKSLEWLAKAEEFARGLWIDFSTNPELVSTWLQTSLGLSAAILVGHELYVFVKSDTPKIIAAWRAYRKAAPANKMADQLFEELDREAKILVEAAEQFWSASSRLELQRRELVNELPTKFKHTKFTKAMDSARKYFIGKDAELSLDFQAEYLALHDTEIQNQLMESPEGLLWLEKWWKAIEQAKQKQPFVATAEMKNLLEEIWKADDLEFKRAMVKIRKEFTLRTPIEQARALSQDTYIRGLLKRSPTGRRWLARWDKNQLKQEWDFGHFLTQYNKSALRTKDFYERLNEASRGWYFQNKDLRLATPDISVEPARTGDLSAVLQTNTLGGAPKYNDVRDLPHEFSTVLKKACQSQFHKLTENRNDSYVGMRNAGLRFTFLALTGAGGGWAYFRGRNTIVKEYKVEPAQAVEMQKQTDAQQTAKIAFEATSPAKVAQKIREWRNAPNNGHARKIFSLFHDQILHNLPAIAKNLRKQLIEKVGEEKFDTKAFDARLEELMASPQMMEGVVELALADASVTEGKFTEPADLENLLLADPKELPKDVQRDQVINYSFGIVPKYLWPLLITDRTTYPVDYSIINPMLKETKLGVESLRRERIAAQPGKSPAAVDAKPQVKDGVSMNEDGENRAAPPPGMPVSSLSPYDALGSSVASTP